MRRLFVLFCAGGVLLAGCTSSDGDSDPTASASASRPAGPSGATTGLAGKIERGVAGLRSAHLDVDAGVLGGKVSGDVTFADGETTASDLTIDQGGAIEVITVGGTSYAKLPASHNTSGKPWVTVSADSSNEFVRALAGQLTLLKAATSLGSLTTLLNTAATSVEDKGAGHYSLTIDPTKATGDIATALGATGAKSLPVDLRIDSRGRPVQVKIVVPLGSQQLPLSIKVSRFDAPIDISAPPAAQVDDS